MTSINYRKISPRTFNEQENEPKRIVMTQMASADGVSERQALLFRTVL